MPIPHLHSHLFFLLLLLRTNHLLITASQDLNFTFPSFSQNNASVLSFSGQSSGIQAGALQVTFDSGSRSLAVQNTSGQIMYSQILQLWDSDPYNYTASFNTSFVLNMGPTQNGGTNESGGGMAFFFSSLPATQLLASYGPYLGLHNSSSSDHSFFAVEFDTFYDPSQSDPDNNHVGIDINSTVSLFNLSLAPYNITLNANVTDAGTNTSVWIDYDGRRHELDVYLAQNGPSLGSKPSSPVISRYPIDLRQHLPPFVYFGFSASTGNVKETHCVLSWAFSSTGYPSSPSASSFKTGHAVALAIGLLAAVLLIAVLILLILLWRRKKKREETFLPDLTGLHYGPRRFEFKKLKKATKGFSDECKLGQGGFGAVYLGKLGSGNDSIEVAVKRLSQNSSQGEKEFKAEIQSIGRMKHKNLVQLLGWSFDGWSGTLLLVYEYMPNGSLDRWLHPRRRDDAVDAADHASMVMDWKRRFHVLEGVASGLLYLHEEWEMVVVHRDLKPSNIMLDSEFNARLGDFGLARFIKNPVAGSGQQQQDSTQTFTIAGTPGYIAPECIETGTITKESDVYSFGAVAIEIATGKRSAENLHWLWTLHEEGKLQEAGRGSGLEEYDGNEMELVLRLGIACCHPQPASRPTMRRIVHELSSAASSAVAADFSSTFPIDRPLSPLYMSGLTFDSLVSLTPSPSQYLLSSTTTTTTTTSNINN